MKLELFHWVSIACTWQCLAIQFLERGERILESCYLLQSPLLPNIDAAFQSGCLFLCFLSSNPMWIQGIPLNLLDILLNLFRQGNGIFIQEAQNRAQITHLRIKRLCPCLHSCPSDGLTKRRRHSDRIDRRDALRMQMQMDIHLTLRDQSLPG